MERLQDTALTSSASESKHGHVLIVYGDMTFTQVLSAHLTRRHWTSTVCSPRIALRDLTKLQPRALILDWDAADVEGQEFLHLLADAGSSAAVVVCSRFERPATSFNVLRELGVTHWLSKPWDPSSLVLALDELLALEQRVD